MQHHRKLFLVLVMIIATWPLTVAAESTRLVISYTDLAINNGPGREYRIPLRRELARLYPHLDLHDHTLVKAVVMARPERGVATIQLQVGRTWTPPISVAGPRHSFQNERARFLKVQLDNPNHDSSGPWQLLLNGRLTLKKIVLVLDRPGHSPGRPWFGAPEPPPARWDAPGYGKRPRDWSHPGGPAPLTLPARTWGTDTEGERRCGTRSANLRDGWDYPDTLCNSSPQATFRATPQPVRLYFRPDIDPGSYPLQGQNVRRLVVTVTIVPEESTPGSRIGAAIGIDLDGSSASRVIDFERLRHSQHNGTTETLTITGNWSSQQLKRAKIWIRPLTGSDSFQLKQFELQALPT